MGVHCAGSWGGAGAGAGHGPQGPLQAAAGLAWLLQGHLYDSWCELFVVREEEGKGEESAWGGGRG